MAEEERVGGISIEASIDDSRVDAELNALLAKMQAASRQLSAALSIAPTIMRAQTQQAASVTEKVSYGRRAASGAEYSSLEKAIAEAQAKEDAALGRVAASTAKTSRTKQAAVVSGLQQSPVISQPVAIAIDTETAKTELAAFLTTFKASMTEAQGAATVKINVEAPPQQVTRQATAAVEKVAAAGGGGGKRRKNVHAAADGDDEGEEATNIQYNRYGAPQLPIVGGGTGVPVRPNRPNRYGVQPISLIGGTENMGESIRLHREQERQGAREMRQAEREAARMRDADRAQQRRAEKEAAHRDLRELSYEAQQQGAATRTSHEVVSTQRTPQEIEAYRRSEAARAASMAAPQGAGRYGPPINLVRSDDYTRRMDQALRASLSSTMRTGPAAAQFPGGNRPPPTSDDATRRARSEQMARDRDRDRERQTEALRGQQRYEGPNVRTRGAAGTGGGVGASATARRRTDEDVERRRAERVASSEAQTFTAGRTLRTFESSLGGYLAGGRARVEAQADLAKANEKVRISERDVDEARKHANLPEVKTNARNYQDALIDVTAAEQRNAAAVNERAKALQRVQSFSGPSAAIRTFAGIGAATVGFSLALKGVGVALDAIGPALADALDSLGGFASKSTAVTSALAQQTAAQKGNAAAVIAQQSATAGLSVAASDYLSTQLKLTTQVKAGGIAEQQASDLFRASLGARQGAAPQGLLGGFGGFLGSSFLAGTLGGGKGFGEEVAGTFGAFQGAQRGQQFGPELRPGTIINGQNLGGSRQPIPPNQQDTAEIARIAADRLQYETDLNKAAQRGAAALGQTADQVTHFGAITAKQAEDIANSNLPDEIKNLAKSNEGLYDSNNKLILTYSDAVKGLEQAAVGRGIPDIQTIGRANLFAEQQRQREAQASIPAQQAQFAYERPAFLANLERQQQFQLTTQLPAQQALQNLAQPLAPVGTGILPANAQEQAKIEKSTERTRDLQKQLNDYYAMGEKVLTDTYQIPQQLVSSIRTIGAEITSTQSALRNEQAGYQVAQYNYQLMIAKRSLADIGGLTGKNFGAGQSYLGTLERQNLALSRQGQLLQFNLQQRQINFQVALAGFQAPGVTPEERQANVAEAKLEAGYAQKQLDIQKQMFGNQVQIVDIQNLRQGADLARQIGLLLQGRKVTIDTAVAEEKLIRLQALQAQQVAQAGTYIQKVDAVVARAFGEIQSLETAAGRAMFNASVYAANAFNTYLTRVVSGLNSMALAGTVAGSDNSGKGQYASGVIGTTTGRTDITVGEAGNETVAVVRNPRMADWGDLGGGGGGPVTITFGDVYVREDGDIDKIARAVTKVIGREGALKGMRGAN